MSGDVKPCPCCGSYDISGCCGERDLIYWATLNCNACHVGFHTSISATTPGCSPQSILAELADRWNRRPDVGDNADDGGVHLQAVELARQGRRVAIPAHNPTIGGIVAELEEAVGVLAEIRDAIRGQKGGAE